jgi:hypothetical protein
LKVFGSQPKLAQGRREEKLRERGGGDERVVVVVLAAMDRVRGCAFLLGVLLAGAISPFLVWICACARLDLSI